MRMTIYIRDNIQFYSKCKFELVQTSWLPVFTSKNMRMNYAYASSVPVNLAHGVSS